MSRLVQPMKEVTGFPLYEDGVDGTLRRKPNKSGKRRSRFQHQYSYPKGSLDRKGYVKVKLYRYDGSTKTVALHRIVAREYCKGYSPDLHVNHKDGDKSNNSASNLEWVTNRDNMKHALQSGLINNRGENGGRNKVSEETVRWIINNRHHTLKEQQEKTGLSRSYIKSIRCGNRWSWLFSELNKERRTA